MKPYTVIGVSVTINSGKIGLSKKQADIRSHNLKALGGSLYEVLSPIQFKSGEVIALPDGQPKSLLEEILAGNGASGNKKPSSVSGKGSATPAAASQRNGNGEVKPDALTPAAGGDDAEKTVAK